MPRALGRVGRQSKRVDECRDVILRPNVAEHDGGIALQAAQLRALHRRALERRSELRAAIASRLTRELARVLPA